MPKTVWGALLALLIDTHILVWIGEGSPRLSPTMRDRLSAVGETLFVSAVTAFEYADLQHRGRIPRQAKLADLETSLQLKMLDFPAHLWTAVEALPSIHADPIDRMLIAHALSLQMPLATADAAISRYPGLEVVWR